MQRRTAILLLVRQQVFDDLGNALRLNDRLLLPCCVRLRCLQDRCLTTEEPRLMRTGKRTRFMAAPRGLEPALKQVQRCQETVRNAPSRKAEPL